MSNLLTGHGRLAMEGRSVIIINDQHGIYWVGVQGVRLRKNV